MYDALPQLHLSARRSRNVARRPNKKGKVLGFACFGLVCLALCAAILTYLRYTQRLQPVWQGIVWVWHLAQWLWQHLTTATGA